AGPAHGAVRKCHQHAPMHDAATVVMFRLGYEPVVIGLAGSALPHRADQRKKALVIVPVPSCGRGIEGRGNGFRHSSPALSARLPLGGYASVSPRRRNRNTL